jgi:uncharacterized sulfatase
MRRVPLSLLLLLALTPEQPISAAPAARTAPPNIVVILSDDQGYATLGAYGGDPKRVVTPHLDRFAAQGARFTDGYVACSTCSPSRAALLNGRYPQRFGYYANIDAKPGAGLPAEEVTLPYFFKSAGYSTAAIGKWHLGTERPGQHPLERGFEEYFGFDSSQTDYFKSPILFRGREKVRSHDYLTAEFSREAAAFIARNRARPFLLYLAYNGVHGPQQAPEDYLRRFGYLPDKREQMQAAMLAALDDGVGEVLGQLDKLNLAENTLVFFLSDNGGLPNWWSGSNGPQRGFKREQWDGGVKVPFLVRWPGRIPGGQVVRDPVIALDILPTALAAAKLALPTDRVIDGVNLLPRLTGQQTRPPHELLFWAGSHVAGDLRGREGQADGPPAWAVRRGPWKALQVFAHGGVKLFNLEKDVGEQHDLAATHPEIALELTAAYVAWFRHAGAQPIAYNRAHYEKLKSVR